MRATMWAVAIVLLVVSLLLLGAALAGDRAGWLTGASAPLWAVLGVRDARADAPLLRGAAMALFALSMLMMTILAAAVPRVVVELPAPSASPRRSEAATCPHCLEDVNADATRCPHCTSTFEEGAEAQRLRWRR